MNRVHHPKGQQGCGGDGRRLRVRLDRRLRRGGIYGHQHYAPALPETEYTAYKVWSGDALADAEVEFILIGHTDMGGADDVLTYESTKRTIGQVATCKDVPAATADGRTLTYELVESAVDGYVSSITESDHVFTVTNTPVEPLSDIVARVEYEDANNIDGLRDSVSVRLQQSADGGVTWETADVDGTDITMQVMDANGGWADYGPATEYSIDMFGSESERTVRWVGLPVAEGTMDGNRLLGSQGLTGFEAAGDMAAGAGSSDYGQTGIEVGEPETSPQTFSEDATDEFVATEPEDEAAEGEQSEEEAHDNGVVGDDANDTPEASSPLLMRVPAAGIRRLAAGAADGLFGLVRTAMAGGADIRYRVVQVYDNGGDNTTMSGYDLFATTPSAGEYLFLNIHEPDTVNVHVKKVWADDAAETTPTHGVVTVTLYADGSFTGKYVNLRDDKLEDTFSGMPRHVAKDDARESTREVVYTLKEDNVPAGHTCTIGTVTEGADGLHFVVTNVYNKPITIRVHKVWQDAEGEAIEPGTTDTPVVVMQLTRDGEELDGTSRHIPNARLAESDDNMWAEWTVPSVDNGERVTYSVEEFVASHPELGLTGEQVKMVEDNQDGVLTVEFANRLTSAKDEPVPTEPDKVIKITYVDHLKGEAEKGSVLSSNFDPLELVLNFKVREDDLSIDPNAIDSFRKPGTRLTTKGITEDGDTDASGSLVDDVPGPAHEGYTFQGRTVNRDSFGDYVMVAHYTTPDEKLTIYVDGESGKHWATEPSAGELTHEGQEFKGWEKVTDGAGNSVYVALYERVDTSAKTEDGGHVRRHARRLRAAAGCYIQAPGSIWSYGVPGAIQTTTGTYPAPTAGMPSATQTTQAPNYATVPTTETAQVQTVQAQGETVYVPYNVGTAPTTTVTGGTTVTATPAAKQPLTATADASIPNAIMALGLASGFALAYAGIRRRR